VSEHCIRVETIVCGLLMLMMLVAPAAADSVASTIRFGLTAAVVREDIDLYQRWGTYLSKKLMRPVQFVQRRTYREAIEMLETGEQDFSWICSFPYAKYRDAKFFGLMAVPVFQGQPFYRSYIIVNRTSSALRLADLEGRVFAYSDPDSNSGYALPRQMVSDLGRDPDHFFRQTFFTYNHTETIEAVAEQVADGAAVDSYVWEYLNRHEPQFTAGTKIIQRSEQFGFPPLVYRMGIDDDLRVRMTNVLLGMQDDPEGQKLLAELMIDRFITAPSSLYDSVPLRTGRP
jgi:phosphonate transport system substrate-binding protein